MSFRYVRDDVLRRIEVVAAGPFAADEIIAVLERVRDEGTESYALLFDGRSMTGEATFDDLYRILEADTLLGSPGATKGPLAIVLTDPALYRRACAYAILASPRRRLEVFEDPDAADVWLREQTTWGGLRKSG